MLHYAGASKTDHVVIFSVKQAKNASSCTTFDTRVTWLKILIFLHSFFLIRKQTCSCSCVISTSLFALIIDQLNIFVLSCVNNTPTDNDRH